MGFGPLLLFYCLRATPRGGGAYGANEGGWPIGRSFIHCAQRGAPFIAMLTEVEKPTTQSFTIPEITTRKCLYYPCGRFTASLGSSRVGTILRSIHTIIIHTV